MRIGLGIVGLLMLIHAACGKRFRYGLYDVDDDSDIELERRTGRMFEAIMGDGVHHRSDVVQRAGMSQRIGPESMSIIGIF
jgi:hypothetical protein